MRTIHGIHVLMASCATHRAQALWGSHNACVERMERTEVPHTIDMRHLRLVAAIAEQGRVTAAASELGLTQPALSHQLRDLESRLRTPLFVRTARRMVPTAAGEQLVAVAREVLRSVAGFERQIRSGDYDQARGSLTLATECYTVYHWLPGVLRAFRERWPAVDLRIAPEHTASPFTALRDGVLDLAVVHTASTDRRIRTDALFDDELVAVSHPRHRFARQPFVTAEDFRPEHLILYSTTDGTIAALRDFLHPAGVVPERITRIQLTEAILELVAADLGVAILSRWAVLPWIRAGTLAATRVTERGFVRQWYVATRTDQPATGYQFDLMDLLRRHVSGGPVVLDAQRSA